MTQGDVVSCQTENKYCTSGMSAKALSRQGDWADCLLMSLCHVRMLECFQHALFLTPTPLLGIVLSRAGVVRPAHRPKRGRTHCPPTFSCKDNRTFSLFVAWHVQDTWISNRYPLYTLPHHRRKNSLFVVWCNRQYIEETVTAGFRPFGWRL